MSSDDSNGWEAYKNLVLHEIKRLDERMTRDLETHMQNYELLASELRESLDRLHDELVSMRESLTKVREDVAGAKVGAGLIGGASGAISSFVAGFFKH